MSMIKWTKEGTAWLTSEKDKRWNNHSVRCICGGFTMPDELKEKVEELKKKFGDPPDDLEFNYMKD